jgi:hypothetical protein
MSILHSSRNNSRHPDRGPTPAELNACLATLRNECAPLIRSMYLGLLRGYVRRGHVPASVIEEFEPQTAREA